MLVEMGMEWYDIPWVLCVEILIGRMMQNAAQEDKHASADYDVGETTEARDRVIEWLSTSPKTPEEVQEEEDDALLGLFGMKRSEVSS